MPFADRTAGEDRDLDRAQKLCATEVRPCRVELFAPTPKLGRGHRSEHSRQRCTTIGIEWRLLEQRHRERSEIEAGAADHQWCSPRVRSLADPTIGFLRPRSRRVALAGIDDVDTSMRDATPLHGRRLGGANVETTVDLPRVGADDGCWPALGEREGDRRFSGRRRATNDAQLSVGQTGDRPRPTVRGRSSHAHARRAPGVPWRLTRCRALASRRATGRPPP